MPIPTGPGVMLRDASGGDVLQALATGVQDWLTNRVAQAGQMTQGPFHQPGGIDQAAGGAMQTFQVVTNPESPAFQYLQKWYPKIAAGLQRMRGVTDLGTETEGPILGLRGYTDNLGGGNSSIRYIPDRVGSTTLPHEALHALYLSKTGGVSAMPPAARAPQILESLSRAPTEAPFRRNPGHAAIEAMAQRLVERAGTPPRP